MSVFVCFFFLGRGGRSYDPHTPHTHIYIYIYMCMYILTGAYIGALLGLEIHGFHWFRLALGSIYQGHFFVQKVTYHIPLPDGQTRLNQLLAISAVWGSLPHEIGRTFLAGRSPAQRPARGGGGGGYYRNTFHTPHEHYSPPPPQNLTPPPQVFPASLSTLT